MQVADYLEGSLDNYSVHSKHIVKHSTDITDKKHFYALLCKHSNT